MKTSRTPRLDSYMRSVSDTDMCAEDKARHIGATPALVEELLRDTVEVLHDDYRAQFRGARFDAERQALVTRDGYLMLMWRLRARPDRPESYQNQQTSLGLVRLYVAHGGFSIHR